MKRIAFLGTSQTYGYCEDLNGSQIDDKDTWVALLSKKLKKQYYNFGHNGATNKDLLNIFVEMHNKGYLDKVDTVIVEPRITLTPVKADATSFLKVKSDTNVYDINTSIIDMTRNNKDYNVSKLGCTLPESSLWYKNISFNYPTEFFYKKLGEPNIKKRYIDNYLELHSLVAGGDLVVVETADILKVIKAMCELKNIKFKWIWWSMPYWETDKKYFGEVYEHLINKSATIEHHFTEREDVYCSCGHLKKERQPEVADILYKELKQ